MNEHNRGEIILEHLDIIDKELMHGVTNASIANNSNNNYKNCPSCGQGLIPFRYGLCICGEQIGFTKFLINKEESYI